MKKFSILIAIDAFFSTFYSLFIGSKKFAFLNCSFTIGMIYLLFGALCFIWEKGFFNITLFSFNKINKQLQKKRGILLEETDLTLDDYIYKKNNFSYTSSLLYSGFIISILTTIISFSLI